LEDKGKEGRIILRRILERCDGTLNSSGSGQKKWQAAANTVIEFGVPQNARKGFEHSWTYQLLNKDCVLYRQFTPCFR
jgi:hypothetical protein